MNVNELNEALDEHKKSCFPKSECKVCKINLKRFTCQRDECCPAQCDWCGDLIDGFKLKHYECVCGKHEVRICRRCHKTGIPNRVLKINHHNLFRFGKNSYYDYVDGIYVDPRCSVSLEEFKDHRKNCFNKSDCDKCHYYIESKTADDEYQCDYCGYLFDCEKLFKYDCKCGGCEYLSLCNKCHDVPHYTIDVEPNEDESTGIYICHYASMTKAAK